MSAFLQNVAASWSAYLSGIVALGVLSMAVLQTVKDLLPIRRLYQQRFLRRWLAAKGGAGVDVPAVERDLIALATDGDRDAFYDLPIEQLCGQMSAAAQVVLDYPASHPALLRCLSSQAPGPAVDRLVNMKTSLRQAFETLKSSPSPQARAELDELGDAKARVMHQIQRSIDALQITAAYRWKLGFQLAAFVLSCGIAFLATGAQEWPIASRLFVALAGGFLAPVARDLQAKLQQVK